MQDLKRGLSQCAGGRTQPVGAGYVGRGVGNGTFFGFGFLDGCFINKQLIYNENWKDMQVLVIVAGTIFLLFDVFGGFGEEERFRQAEMRFVVHCVVVRRVVAVRMMMQVVNALAHHDAERIFVVVVRNHSRRENHQRRKKDKQYGEFFPQIEIFAQR
jgi:hypothetical protein